MLDTEKNWTRWELMDVATRLLETAGIAEARRNVEWMLGEVLQCSRAMLYAEPKCVVAPEAVRGLKAMLQRRVRHEPVQYILGHAAFYGLRLRVTPDVLIPRPETEQVVETALRLLKPRTAPRILDVGTGSGCIALTLKHERPDAEVYACDISEAALAVAVANADAYGLEVSFMPADVLASDFTDHVPGPLDLLISNPPYITHAEAPALDPEVRDYEPHRALFAGEDPLCFYRSIVQATDVLLVPDGHLVFEAHADHAASVRDLLMRTGFKAVQCQHDLAGYPRIVTAQRPAD